jgi:hypothetical protein
MKRTVKINPKAQLDDARAFWLAFQRCMEQRPLPNGQVEWLFVPAVVCAAFSIEIGFKAIIMSEGNTASQVHELAKLFKEISPAAQDSIVKEVGLDPAAFTAGLESASNAFDQWRYYYEKGSLQANLNFLAKLANATQ